MSPRRHRRLPLPAPEPLSGDTRFSVGDPVEIIPTGQEGVVEAIEGPDQITGVTHLHIRIEVCPWLLVQPSITVVPADVTAELGATADRGKPLRRAGLA